MHRHPQLNLFVHSNEALADLVGGPLISREQIHAWPLSSVELLCTASGERFIYKVQREPTVEPEFLARAQSPLLPTCRLLARDTRQAAVLFPFWETPTLRDEVVDAERLVDHGRRLVQQIGRIERADDPLPVYRDLGTIDAWSAFAAETLAMLSALVASGAFPRVSRDDVEWLERWVQDAAVRETIEGTSQLIHGDLKAEHVFGAPDGGYRVIDWQRPYRAPGEIDLVTLLESRGIAPADFVAPPVIGLRAFLLVHWAAEARTHLLPDLPFFDTWARSSIDTIRAAAR